MSEPTDNFDQSAMTAPKVENERIDALMEQVSVHAQRVAYTTTTVATAILPSGFVLAVEYSACVSHENFDPAIGMRIASEKAEKAARAELWKLEGYKLHEDLAAEVRMARAVNWWRDNLEGMRLPLSALDELERYLWEALRGDHSGED